MSLRNYAVYLKGGASFSIKAARFERDDDGVHFYDDEGQPLADTYIDPSEVIAVLPPGPSVGGRFPSLASESLRNK